MASASEPLPPPPPPTAASPPSALSDAASEDAASEDAASEEEKPCIHLGFVSEDDRNTDPFTCMGYTLWDGGKVGGRPFNLNPQHPLSRKSDDLFCQLCDDKPPLQFLIQIYAPADDVTLSAFHRMLYVFVCTTVGCPSSQCVRVQLPEANGFHAPTNEEVRKDASKTLPRGYGHEDLCGVCGLKAEGQRCPTQEMFFCSRAHQKDYMKAVTKRLMADQKEGTLDGMFQEFAMEVFEDEGLADDADEDAEIKKMNELNESLADTELDEDTDQLSADMETKGESGVSDAATADFLEKVGQSPDQCLRYSRWSTDAQVWSRTSHQPKAIPCCENCGSERIFEFQITPQILSFLKVEMPKKVAQKKGFLKTQDVDGATVTKNGAGTTEGEDTPPDPATNPMNMQTSKVDFGSLYVYTCSMACEIAPGKNAKEYCWAQPALDNEN